MAATKLLDQGITQCDITQLILSSQVKNETGTVSGIFKNLYKDFISYNNLK